MVRRDQKLLGISRSLKVILQGEPTDRGWHQRVEWVEGLAARADRLATPPVETKKIPRGGCGSRAMIRAWPILRR